MAPFVSELWFYPVKSCRGISLPHARLDRWGIVEDRSFMVVDASGRFLSQRTHASLCLVTPSFEADALVLTAPGQTALRVPRAAAADPEREVEVWNDRCAAQEVLAGSAWFSSYLGEPCSLVRRGPQFHRPVEPGWAPPGAQVGFADAYPLLLISEESLADLNARLEAPLEMARFRPNVVVRGAPAPYAEDGWGAMRVGDIPLRGVKTCKRCAITTVDPHTGARGPEPLRTLATYRRARGGVIFGQNVVHEAEGELRVGDALEVYAAVAR